jgi:sialate O-acetylesterase
MILQQQAEVAVWGWDHSSKNISVYTSWNRKKYTTQCDADGHWKLNIATPSAGGPFALEISDGKEIKKINNVLIGEVWLCSGQSNMEMPMKGFRDQPVSGSNDVILKSTNKNIRLIKIPRSSKTTAQDTAKPTQWQEADPESVANFSATGYYFGKLLHQILNNIPVGLINVSYGGSKIEAWMSAETLKEFTGIETPKATDSIKSVNQTPTVLFNGMLHPVIGYGIKGCIWYQGESNYDLPDQYQSLFTAMVKEWRSLWQEGDFPFYFAQIAPFNYASLPPYHSGGKYNSAFLRDAQRKSLQTISNSAMVSLMDIGEENSIHPMHKEEGGSRFAYLALAKTYGIKGFADASPILDTIIITKNIATVKFLNAPNGLTSFGKELTQFEISGADKIFYPATAVISKGTVLVSSPMVKEPVAVRYAFKDFIKGELFSTDGLPVASFRTDSWNY